MSKEVETELQKEGCQECTERDRNPQLFSPEEESSDPPRQASSLLLKTQIPKCSTLLFSPLVLLLPPPPPLPLSWPILQGNLKIDDMSELLSGISAEWAPGMPLPRRWE